MKAIAAIVIAVCASRAYAADVVLGTTADLTWTGSGAVRVATWAAGGADGTWAYTDLGAPLKAWYTCADTSTVTVVSGAVSRWDSKVNSIYADQSTTNQRPILQASAINGYCALRFDGTNDALTSATKLFASTNSGAFFAVCRRLTGTDQRNVYQERGGQSSGDTFNMLDRVGGASNRRFAKDGIAASSSATSTNVVLFCGLFTSAKVELWETGVLAASNVTATAKSVYNYASIGATVNVAAPATWPGYISEIIMVVPSPTAADRQRIEGRMMHDFGLQSMLPASHPYRTYAP
jgi:hypothetical protein